MIKVNSVSVLVGRLCLREAMDEVVGWLKHCNLSLSPP